MYWKWVEKVERKILWHWRFCSFKGIAAICTKYLFWRNQTEGNPLCRAQYKSCLTPCKSWIVGPAHLLGLTMFLQQYTIMSCTCVCVPNLNPQNPPHSKNLTRKHTRGFTSSHKVMTQQWFLRKHLSCCLFLLESFFCFLRKNEVFSVDYRSLQLCTGF